MFQAPPTAAPVQNPHLPTFQEYSSLLPPNMTIYEMAFEPKESQYKWYLKLLEIHGQESANKFTEILRQAMGIMHNSKAATTTSLQTNQQQLPLQLTQHHQQQQQHPALMPRSSVGFAGPPSNLLGPIRGSTPPPASEPAMNFNQQIDMVFNSLMNGNDISQPILRELLGMVGSVSGLNSNCNNSCPPSGNINSGNVANIHTVGKEFPINLQHKTTASPLFPNQQTIMASGNGK